MHQNLVWYIPSFHGDIRLEDVGGATRLDTTDLTPGEVEALATLRRKAIKSTFGAPWASAADFSDPATWKTAHSLVLQAPIAKVQGVLAKALKPGKSLLAAVRFADGKIEEAWKQPATSPYREAAALPAAPPAPPVAAATVAAPIIGCPAPAFDLAEQRASRVLRAFLTPDQTEDFLARGQFLSTGLDTGHRYLLTSRERPDRLARTGGRSLFSVTEDIPWCTHDWDVPAAEELLSLHLHLVTPGGETYLRQNAA